MILWYLPMDKQKLRYHLMKIAKEQNINYNTLLLFFFMEEFIKRISLSDYQNYFVFKGGFLLSSILGLSTRTTTDIDFNIQKIPLNHENIRSIVENIIAHVNDQDVTYEIMDISDIKKIEDYEGFHVTFIAKMFNIKERFSIDIATGDPITPDKISYSYVTLIDHMVIDIPAYNLETILAEKLHAIYNNGIMNIRCKDFYDIHIILTTRKKDINHHHLFDAVQKTFHHRKTNFDKSDMEKTLSEIRKNELMNQRWRNYSKKHTYAKNLSFKEMLDDIDQLLALMLEGDYVM